MRLVAVACSGLGGVAGTQQHQAQDAARRHRHQIAPQQSIFAAVLVFEEQHRHLAPGRVNHIAMAGEVQNGRAATEGATQFGLSGRGAMSLQGNAAVGERPADGAQFIVQLQAVAFAGVAVFVH